MNQSKFLSLSPDRIGQYVKMKGIYLRVSENHVENTQTCWVWPVIIVCGSQVIDQTSSVKSLKWN